MVPTLKQTNQVHIFPYFRYILILSSTLHLSLPSFHVIKQLVCGIVSSGMLRRVALVRTDVSEELSASFIRVTRISELGTTLALTSNRRTASYS
jgi:hypothetical protein